MPTMTGWPAASLAEIQAHVGLRLMVAGCPGTLKAPFRMAPFIWNRPAWAAIVAGVTFVYPKCEETIARSDSRQPIFQMGKGEDPTDAAAHRASRWLK